MKRQALKHARAAIDQAACFLDALRSWAEDGGLAREHLAREHLAREHLARERAPMLQGTIHDLEKRHVALAELYRDMAACSPAALPEIWRAFFACYDDFLESSRRHRRDLLSSH